MKTYLLAGVLFIALSIADFYLFNNQIRSAYFGGAATGMFLAAFDKT